MAQPSHRSRAWLFMSPRDIALFLRSARTDARIATLRQAQGARAAFEDAYAGAADPWASADPRYFYQRWKYERLMATLPPGRRFGRVLDLGCGVGALSQALTAVSDDVLGLDIAQSAADGAAQRAGGRAGLRFAQGDIGALDPALDGQFDLVVIADTLYYLDATDDPSLRRTVARIVRLLAPGGLCLVANHYFFAADADSRLSRRIHQRFAEDPGLAPVSHARRPFYLVSLHRRAGAPAGPVPA